MLRVSASLHHGARAAAAAVMIWQQKILLRFGSRFFPCVLFPACSRVLYLETAGWSAGLVRVCLIGKTTLTCVVQLKLLIWPWR